VFERFTEPARHVVVLAQEEARRLDHGYIGTEHLLLGLLRQEDGIAARALVSLGIALEPVRSRVAGLVGRGESRETGQIPFTPRAKKVLELSLREAQALGHRHIGTEHVLLGLGREGEGVAMRVLLDLGADAGRIRSAVIKQLSGPEVTTEAATQLPPEEEQQEEEEAPPTGGRRFPWPAVVAGWLAFGVAIGIGLLLGRLIWG
jgi:ATP-dependent Clp protease ATP-binding subunit ClpC